MTRVTYDPAAMRMSIEGHAGAGEPGHDLVCAAASILMLTMEAALRELGWWEQVSILKKPGMAEFSCCPGKKRMEQSREIFALIFLGYQTLEGICPGYVKTFIA